MKATQGDTLSSVVADSCHMTANPSVCWSQPTETMNLCRSTGLGKSFLPIFAMQVWGVNMFAPHVCLKDCHCSWKVGLDSLNDDGHCDRPR